MPSTASCSDPHPDRLLPADPACAAIARRLYAEVRDLPLISPHGHVDPRLLLDDAPFADPATLLVHAGPLRDPAAARVRRPARATSVSARDALDGGRSARAPGGCSASTGRSSAARRSATGSRSQLAEIFGVTERPSAETADAIYDEIAEPPGASRSSGPARCTTGSASRCSRRPTTRPTTWRRTPRCAADPTVARRASSRPSGPTAIWSPHAPGWRGAWPPGAGRRHRHRALRRLSGGAGGAAPLLHRRTAPSSADHAIPTSGTEPLPTAEADRIYRAALRGRRPPTAEATAFRRHMLLEMARMSCEDGLVMTLHPGVLPRPSPGDRSQQFGPDTGHDIPVRAEFTDALRAAAASASAPTRPSPGAVHRRRDRRSRARSRRWPASTRRCTSGAPWWFLDAPDAIRRFRAAVTETAGFSRTAGFVDDTRAFCSIPARHDMSRRVDAGYLAGLVAEHRLDEDEAVDTARALVVDNPRTVFKL